MGNKFILFFLIIIFFCCSGLAISQEKYALEIEIENIRSEKGKIFFQFLDKNQNLLEEIVADIEKGKCIIYINDMKPGKYAFRYFHDENNNQKMDKNLLGIPREGFGFSNDPAILVGEPSFDKWVFYINNHTKINTVIKYF